MCQFSHYISEQKSLMNYIITKSIQGHVVYPPLNNSEYLSHYPDRGPYTLLKAKYQHTSKSKELTT